MWKRYLSPGACYATPAEGVPLFLQDLFDQGLLVSSKVDELDRVKIHFQKIRYDTSGLRVLIAPTMLCNLRCPYCFEDGARRDRRLRPMSIRTEKLTSDYIIDQCEDKQELIINWFGGEPLLCLSTIERISDSLIKRINFSRIAYRAQITTNGVLLDEISARRLSELYVQECQITVDVPQTNKLNSKGKPVLQKQLDNISLIAEFMDVKLRINVGMDLEEEFDSMYHDLLSRNLQDKLNRVHITPVLPVECNSTSCNRPISLKQPETMAFLRRERNKAKELGFPVSEPFPSAVKPCGATCVTQTLIDPQGFLYKCPSDLGMQERSFGSIYSSKPFQPQNLLPWLTYDWFKFEDCQNCKLLPRCAGGCPHRRMHRYGDSYCLYNPREVENLSDVLRAIAYGQTV
jgi:uncharacterized protein